jgi:hypothetical protein
MSGLPIGHAIGRTGLKQLRHRKDDQPDETSDQRAVDANILQVAPDREFDPLGQRGGIGRGRFSCSNCQTAALLC